MGTQLSSFDAGQRGEFQHSQRLPTQIRRKGRRIVPQITLRAMSGADGHGVDRGGDKKGARLGNRFAQEVNQCIADALNDFGFWRTFGEAVESSCVAFGARADQS